tara:strand:+ start:241 stop:375 length:135 start_codon:yes stop_codon:yes gene_type:complete
MEYIVQMSQQMKDLAEDGDTKLNEVLERIENLETQLAEILRKLV